MGAYGKNSFTGAAYIFTRTGTVWTEQQKILSSDIQSGDRFGVYASISGDTVMVGACNEDTGGSEAGAVYIFTRSGTTWTEQQKIQSSDIVAGDSFGTSVAIYDDEAVISTPWKGTGTGAIYTFAILPKDYPTNQSHYLHTSDTNSIPIYHAQTINSCSIIHIQPEHTSIKGLISFDSRLTWKKWNGASWLAHTGGLTNLQTGNTIDQIQTGLTGYHVNGAGTYLDFAFDLATTYSGSTPEIDQITVDYLVVEELYTEIADWNSASGTASLWTKVSEVSSTSDTELRIYYDKDHDDNLTHVGDTSEVLDINYDMVVDIGSEGYYDTGYAFCPNVIRESNTSYEMWYSGHDGSNWRIIYCTSTNGTTWSSFQMVVNIGSEGVYDTLHVGHSRVIKESDTSYKMWYAGRSSSNWRIIYCTSTNGITWANHQMVVNIGAEGTYDTSSAGYPYVIKESNTSYKMWYAGYNGSNWRIIYCTSTDGTTWTNYQVVVNIGSEGTYDTSGALSPSVIKESDTSYKMWYTGYNGSNWRIIYCTSTDGITWSNHQTVVNIGSEGTYDASHSYALVVVKEYDNKYQMWYTGGNNVNERIIYTESYLPTWDRTVSQEVWSNNFTGVWHMEQDPSGGSNCILDSTLNENHNTSYGTMTAADLVPGLIGNNLDYDGSDDRIKPVNDYGVSSTDLIFIESSFKTTVGSYQRVITRYQGVAPSGYYGWMFYIYTDGYARFHIDKSQQASSDAVSNNVLTGDTWYNVVISKPPGNSVTHELFMDGVKQTQTGTSQTGLTHSNHITIGIDGYNNVHPFEGMMDEVRFSSIIRSDAWIKTNNDSLRDSLLTFDNAPYTISGTNYYFEGNVKEKNIPVNRVLYLHRRLDGSLIGQVSSSGTGGYFNMITPYNEAHYIVCLDNGPGEVYNDLVRGNVFPDSQEWSYDA